MKILPVFCKWYNSIPFLFSVPKKYQYHLPEIFHRNFRANGKRFRSFFVVQICCVENARGGDGKEGKRVSSYFLLSLPLSPRSLQMIRGRMGSCKRRLGTSQPPQSYNLWAGKLKSYLNFEKVLTDQLSWQLNR